MDIQSLPRENLQNTQISQRDHAAGCVIVFAKSRRLGLGNNILRTLYHCEVISLRTRPAKLSNSVKKNAK